jgi:hypothetical protein
MQLPFIFLIYSLHVSAPTGHPQVLMHWNFVVIDGVIKNQLDKYSIECSTQRLKKSVYAICGVCCLLTTWRTQCKCSVTERIIVLLNTREINRKHTDRIYTNMCYDLHNWWCGFKQSYTLFKLPLWYAGIPRSACDICWLSCCVHVCYYGAANAKVSTKMRLQDLTLCSRWTSFQPLV